VKTEQSSHTKTKITESTNSSHPAATQSKSSQPAHHYGNLPTPKTTNPRQKTRLLLLDRPTQTRHNPHHRPSDNNPHQQRTNNPHQQRKRLQNNQLHRRSPQPPLHLHPPKTKMRIYQFKRPPYPTHYKNTTPNSPTNEAYFWTLKEIEITPQTDPETIILINQQTLTYQDKDYKIYYHSPHRVRNNQINIFTTRTCKSTNSTANPSPPSKATNSSTTGNSNSHQTSHQQQTPTQ